MKVLSDDERIYFRNQLREARATALRDAEAFHGMLFTIERIGSYLAGKIGDLGKYGCCIEQLASSSALFLEDLPSDSRRNWHVPFSVLYEAVRVARNEALHQGAYARHLTTHAIQLCLVLEDALMSNTGRVSDYMVRNVVSASEWQPISFIRQQMLENSFTYLPVSIGSKWYLISDASIAKYLPRSDSKQRKERLAKRLQEALESGLELGKAAKQCKPDTSIEEALELFKDDERPILVLSNEEPKSPGNPKELLGILTAFDLL